MSLAVTEASSSQDKTYSSRCCWFLTPWMEKLSHWSPQGEAEMCLYCLPRASEAASPGRKQSHQLTKITVKPCFTACSRILLGPVPQGHCGGGIDMPQRPLVSRCCSWLTRVELSLWQSADMGLAVWHRRWPLENWHLIYRQSRAPQAVLDFSPELLEKAKSLPSTTLITRSFVFSWGGQQGGSARRSNNAC